MNSCEEKIKKNICRLRKTYEIEFLKKTSSFISLGLENQYDLTLRREQESSSLTVDTLIEKMLYSDLSKVLLLGGPGAGKSTLLLKIASFLTNKEYNKNYYIPILIKCGLEKNDNIKELIHISMFSVKEKEILLDEGRLILIFDGINEVSNMEVREFLNKIIIFSEEYPECKYILSCRSLEFPALDYSPFEKFSIMPVTYEQIRDNFKKELGYDKGDMYYTKLCHSSQNYLLDICRTPLLLSLVVTILSDDNNSISLEKLRNKSDIYEEFYKSLTNRQLMKNTVSSTYSKYYELRDEIFKTLSFYMQAKGIVYIEET